MSAAPWQTRGSWVLSGLAILFFTLDGAMKLNPPSFVLESGEQIGFVGVALNREIGILLLAGTLLYALPRTTFLGAIILTGYLGGAVAAHMRVGDPLFTHILSGVYAGLIVWGGLYLRDSRLRALLPLTAARPSASPAAGATPKPATE